MGRNSSSPKIVVIGGSAGALGDLLEIVRRLPADLTPPLLSVIHFPAGETSSLPNILTRESEMHAKHPESGDKLRPAHMYIAPPDLHLTIKDGRVELLRGPRENGHRPAIDPLFRSAAAAYGNGVIGVLLSGSGDDGTAGLAEIKAQGGTAICVDPDTTPFWMMPESAIDEVDVDEVLPAEHIGEAIVRLCCPGKQPLSVTNGNGRRRKTQNPAMEVSEMRGRTDPNGHPTALTCPECSGPLFDDSKRGVPAFRCRTGHRYSLGSLLMERTESVERALWVAIEALREKAILAGNMAATARRMNNNFSAERYEYQAGTADRYASMIEEFFTARDEPEEAIARAQAEAPGS